MAERAELAAANERTRRLPHRLFGSRMYNSLASFSFLFFPPSFLLFIVPPIRRSREFYPSSLSKRETGICIFKWNLLLFSLCLFFLFLLDFSWGDTPCSVFRVRERMYSKRFQGRRRRKNFVRISREECECCCELVFADRERNM